jgi:hypothetical protein
MADMPTCAKCTKQHWRFVACADAPASPRVIRRTDDFQVPIPAGYHEWGDKLAVRDRDGWLIRDKS